MINIMKTITLNNEEFRQVLIPNTNYDYFVSKDGIVISKSTTGIIKRLKPFIRKSGYYYLNFLDRSKPKTLNVGKYRRFYHNRTIGLYVLVASAWLNDGIMVPEEFCVNHKDQDKSNNKLSNLEIVTHQENLLHARENYTYVTKRTKQNKNGTIRVRFYVNISGKYIGSYLTEIEACQVAYDYIVDNLIPVNKYMKFHQDIKKVPNFIG